MTIVFVSILFGIVSIIILALSSLMGWGIPISLTALAFVFPPFFIAYERYVNKPGPDESDLEEYYPNIRIWGYGLILGIGVSITYLFSYSVVSRVEKPYTIESATSALSKTSSALSAAADTNSGFVDSTRSSMMEHSADLARHSTEVASIAMWRDGTLLFFLAVGLAIVMYSLVNISRSEI